MKALIMAGGEGTRLRPLTCNRPKPMVPVFNRPVMEHIVNLLKKHHITQIGVTLQYMPQVIQDYFGDGSNFGVEMNYFIEETPLGTAGSVKNADEFLDDTFLVISGDALTDIDLGRAIEYHKNKNAIATLVLAKVDVPLEYGVVVTDNNGKITRFLEKPSWSEVFSDTVNTGIYILHPEVLNYFNKGEKFDFSKDLFPMLMEDEQPMYGYVADGYWCDIGDLAAYQQCHFDILDGKVKVKMNANQISEKVWTEEGVELGKGTQVTGPAFIGQNTRIKDFAVISPYSVLGRDNIIGEYTTIKRSILWNGCKIGKKVQLRGCTLCNKVHIKENSSVFEQSVIGDDTLMKERSVTKPGIKVWPSKKIESDTELSVNLVWGTKYSKTLFGDKGIVGEVNVDITPEFASRLGASYGALLSNNARVAIAGDDTNASEMLKNSFIAGLLSSGVEVYDFGQQLLPITRSAVRFYGLDGGIHLGIAATNNDSRLFIDFLDSSGININRGLERKLENIFIREDFFRCEADKVKNVNKMKDYPSYYLRDQINNLTHKNMDYKIVVNTTSRLVESMITTMLNELHCDVRVTRSDIKSNKGMTDFLNNVVDIEADFGAIIDNNSEKMILIDEKGQPVSEEMFTVLTALVAMETTENATVYVPISSPSVIDRIAQKYNGKVVRTKTSPLEVMGQMISGTEKQASFSSQFILNFDAVGGLVRVMDYLKTKNMRLSQLLEHIPAFYMSKKEVGCPWKAKGKVIRQIIEESDGEEVELMEGVKIYKDGGWVLVLPDAEKPVCKVIGEGYSEEFAESITDDFARRVREIGEKEEERER